MRFKNVITCSSEVYTESVSASFSRNRGLIVCSKICDNPMVAYFDEWLRS